MDDQATRRVGGNRQIAKSTLASGRRIMATSEIASPCGGTIGEMAVSETASTEAEALWRAHAGDTVTAILRHGDRYHLTLDNLVCFNVDAGALAAALPMPTGDWGTLLCSLMVAEAAWDAGLPDAAIPGILQAFRMSLAMTGAPEQAMLQIQPNLRLARAVERYVGLPEGLAHDRARIAHFSPEALTGRSGNRLVQEMQSDPAKQRDLVGAYRQMLDRCLDDAIQAVRDARDSGDYAEAADLFQRFFQCGLEITSADEWQDRLSQLDAAREGNAD